VDGLAEWLPARVREHGGDPDRVELFDHVHNDVWCRDHGPIFVKEERSGEVAVTDWGFNGWGGRFAPWDLDDAIPKQVASALGMRLIDGGMILEGGAIEVNGAGQLLTTEAVLLNPNRNPEMGRQEIEERLGEVLGVREVLWLERGIEGDDTGGHVDDLARFVNDTTIVAAVDQDAGSPNDLVLEGNLQRLRGFRTPDGRPFEVVELPMPEACEVSGWRLPVLPASYVNFLIVNGGVLVPAFRQRTNDDRALGMMRELFPGREVVGVDCLDLVEEGGSLHCVSQQQPAAG
jgi:agmatine deiminase